MLIRAVLRGAGLFVRVQLGQNYERRLCSGVPNDAECLILTHIRGVFPMLKSQKLRVPSDDKQQNRDGVARQRLCTRTRSCAGR